MDVIVKVIDFDGKIFGGRILSRDESGSKFFFLCCFVCICFVLIGYKVLV